MVTTRLVIVARVPSRAAPARLAVRAARPPSRVRVMAKIGYARVSTRSQKDDSQVDDLTAYGCDRIFTDKTSGKLAERPELDKALAYLREGDVFVITRLSRAMRSLKHLLALADELRERGVGLVVLKQHIDTTTPTLGLSDLLAQAIDSAGKGFLERQIRVESTRSRPVGPTRNFRVGSAPNYSDMVGSVFFAVPAVAMVSILTLPIVRAAGLSA